jgi:hypothetical protein
VGFAEEARPTPVMGMLGLDLLGFGGFLDPWYFFGSRGSVAVHATRVFSGGGAVAARGTLPGDSGACFRGGRGVEGRENLAQFAQLEEDLIHLGLGGKEFCKNDRGEG